MIKVLFCGLKYEYGNPSAGLSFEYRNFYDTLVRMQDVQADFFAVDELAAAIGRDEMNRQLLRAVEEQQPDLLFCFLFTEELKKETIGYITSHTKTKTFNWFADDHWRVPVYSRFWAPFFTLVSTTDSRALAEYLRYGITNVVKTQWAANHFLYRPHKVWEGDAYDITFVGKKYGKRGRYVEYLNRNGLQATGFGSGWPAGRIDFQKMLEVFSNSKINLNFSETHYYGWQAKMKLLAKLFVRKELNGYRLSIGSPVSNFRSAFGTQQQAIKGRTFEVPACGGFLLTGKSADDISEYYVPDKEIVLFDNPDDMVEKCRYYLEHEQARREIAEAGYRRTLQEHTYEQRFREIFLALDFD